jgi:hypothetical protein
MINLEGCELTHELTRNEKENVQAMFFYRKYEKFLKEANFNKGNLIFIRAALKNNELDTKNYNAALELESTFKNNAIENWNLAQDELKKYNEFELNRKYPN